jgi:hypothetical protein
MIPVTPQSTPSPLLRAVLRAMAPLVRWLVRSGVGYTEFAMALKPVFLGEARREALRTGGKATDSALSLLSGLHRKDVRKAAVEAVENGVVTAPARASLPSQVVARWVALGWPDSLNIVGENSFETLVKSVSTDLHPRAVQNELVRLGVARVESGVIELMRRAFMPDPSKNEGHELLADSVADHLSAGVHNLIDGTQRKFLEQSVFADGLSAESARVLEQLANRLWQEVMTSVVKAAVPLCEHDEPRGGDQRLRLGMFCYSEPMSCNDSAPLVQAAKPAMAQSDSTQQGTTT